MGVSAVPQQPQLDDGRYGDKPIDDATFSLNDMPEGTFYNPLPMDTAAQAREFWRTTEIPDEVLIRFQAVHNKRHKAELEAEYEARWNAYAPQWREAHPKAKKESDQEYAARIRAEKQSFAHRVGLDVDAAIRPELHHYNRRQVVRALAIMANLPDDPDEAHELSRNTRMQLYGYQGTTPVADVVAFFRLDEDPYHRVLDGPDEELEIGMAVSLERIDDNLHWMRDEQRDIGNSIAESTATTAANTDPNHFT